MFITFLQVCFVSLRESTCETRKNVFYFTSKALLVLKINQILFFRYSNAMASSDAQAWNIKHILLNKLGSKHSLVMKFSQFVQHYKRKIFIQKLCEKYGLETSSRPFLIFKESSLKSNLRCMLIWTNFDSFAIT